MFYENYYWGMNLIWWFLWIILMIWIFAIPYDIPGERKRKESPVDILKRKFASGEINTYEYQERKRILESELPIQDRL